MQNWIPYQISKERNAWVAYWLCLGDHIFREPFFEESIKICKRLEVNKGAAKKATSLAGLKKASENLYSIPPTAFIFHVSRCGSTMMTQLLSLQDENIVISEAPVLDTILRWKFNGRRFSNNTRLNCLNHATRILGQKRFDFQQRYFIKWDSWHLFFLNEIRQLFPSVPFVFLTREIEKVVDSHLKIPGMQAIRGVLEPAIFGYNLKQVYGMNPTGYIVDIISKMTNAAHDFLRNDHNSLHLPYEDGVKFNYEKMLHYLNMPTNETVEAIIDARLKMHSKRPSQQFEPAP